MRVCIYIPFLFLFFLITVYRRKPSAKAKYMQAAGVDAASGSDDWTPPARYCLSYFVFHWMLTNSSTVKSFSNHRRITHLHRLDFFAWTTSLSGWVSRWWGHLCHGWGFCQWSSCRIWQVSIIYLSSWVKFIFCFSDTPHHAIKEPALPTECQTERKSKRYAFISVASGYK